jgi:hypothetical protein
VFLRAANGPIEYAASCLMGNKIQLGLEEVGVDGLRDAFMRGLGEVARLAGVPRAEVERVVPLAELAAVEERLRVSHPRAIGAWRLHAGQFGFLDVMTALTVDGRGPDIAMCIARVAGKVRHDSELAQPLEALAVDVGAWAELVERTRAQLEDLSWLTAALRRRTILRAVLAIGVLTMLIGVTAAIVAIRLASDAAEARVARVSDCDAERLTKADLAWASTTDRAKVKEKIERCAAEREIAEAARIKEEEEQARQKKLDEAAQARAKACSELASDVEKGALSETSKTTAGDAAKFLERVATKKLEPADIGPNDPVFSCGDRPDGKRLEAAYSDALMANAPLWIRNGEPSEHAQKAIAAKKDSIDKLALIGVADEAEKSAKAALNGGDKKVLERAKRRCAVAKALGVGGHRGCNGIANL